ncbi:MAG: tRNA (N6-threonylcarbamoyladenosine(37)-N6)-methyltransferase TrmO [Desulfatitalea sp.]|nr:tRNA (N6-threonylcarbamoyladenosine(37)-N6)-methyltransferase TrmO [Desulfatitalea sp.]NNK00485.1 tRNA (N6-threonylcarbamoyladenosine(37)-N6)-methyltransferase TrmO [Desulfatitalea sp.]
MDICFSPIGWVRTDVTDDAVPHFYAVSGVEGTLELLPEFAPGLADLKIGQQIAVLFHFHRSPPFSKTMLKQVPRKRKEPRGIFSICSPKRPNAIGLSVVDIISITGRRIGVKGLDMLDGTPILDIKPHSSNK